MSRRNVLRIGQHRIQHALVAALGAVLEQLIEGQRRIDFQRRRRRRTAPRNVRAVEHRVVLVDRRIRFFAAQHQTRQFGLVPDPLRDDLIDAGAAANRAAGGQRCAGEQVAGLRAVNVSLERLGVVQAADKDHAIAKVVQRMQDLAQFHRLALALGPPLVVGGSRSRRNRIAIRVGAWPPFAGRSARRPHTRSDSIQGRAIVTPRPRSIVRRERRYGVHLVSLESCHRAS